MKTMGKFIRLLLMLMFTICMLVGCGGKKTEPSSTDSEPEQMAQTEAEEPAEPEPESEMDIIEIDGYTTPIIQFGLPKNGTYEMSEFDYNDGVEILDGDYSMTFYLESRDKYVDGSAVYCSFEEMIEYRKEQGLYTIEEVTYAGIDGYMQDLGFGRVILLLPFDDSLQRYPNTPSILEIRIAGESEDPKDLTDYIATEEVQMILNSIQFLAPTAIDEPVEEEVEIVEVEEDMGLNPKYEINGVTISATLPEQNWCYDKNGFGVNYYNVATLDDVWSNTAKIRVNAKETAEKFDFYIDEFEDLQTIDNRTIGGIDMVGRTYNYVGMEWTEYIGVIDDTHAVSVLITRADMTEGNAILDSITFSVEAN